MTSHQGSASTFYDCCQAIPIVTLDDTEVKKTGPGLSSPMLICICVRAPHVVSLIHFTGVWSEYETPFQSLHSRGCFFWFFDVSVPHQPHCGGANGCWEWWIHRAKPSEDSASQCSWKLGFHLPAFVTYRKAHRLISLFPQMLPLRARHQPLLRSWKPLTTADQSLLRNC